MSRRAAVVEEFDDDTDLPLPNRPLPNMGTRGAILEQLGASDGENGDDDNDDDDEDDGEDGADALAGPASPSLAQFRASSGAATDGTKTVTDITPYKKYVFFLCKALPSLPPAVRRQNEDEDKNRY